MVSYQPSVPAIFFHLRKSFLIQRALVVEKFSIPLAQIVD